MDPVRGGVNGRAAAVAMSELGLGCVKTQRRCDDVDCAFRQVAFLVVEASWAWSVAIDFGKLFSSSFNFSSFYTARDKTGKAQCDHMFSALPLKADIAQCSWHVRKPSTKPVLTSLKRDFRN